MIYDVIIVGAGPAGLTASIYGKRAGLNTLVLDASPIAGGQILSTYEVDNYPGLPGISGADLGARLKEHALGLGVEFATGRVKEIIDKGATKDLITRKGNFETKALIIATGASNKKLGCPGEEELSGMGVSYCATCDGAFFNGKDVAVVGGGDVALEDALYLARTCSKVYLIHRRDEFRGANILVDEVKANSKIEILYFNEVKSINGTDKVESITTFDNRTNAEKTLPVDGIFLAVGISPNTGAIAGLPKQNESGYIIADETCETSVPGIFAAGDVRTKQLRQITTACADGANAITSVERFLRNI